MCHVPTASIFTHPASNYFPLGRIDEDLAMDYAQRRGE
nr:vitamin B12 dependent-methionine synthase activation domain-containing protein [Rodentibacter mrazii]